MTDYSSTLKGSEATRSVLPLGRRDRALTGCGPDWTVPVSRRRETTGLVVPSPCRSFGSSAGGGVQGGGVHGPPPHPRFVHVSGPVARHDWPSRSGRVPDPRPRTLQERGVGPPEQWVRLCGRLRLHKVTVVVVQHVSAFRVRLRRPHRRPRRYRRHPRDTGRRFSSGDTEVSDRGTTRDRTTTTCLPRPPIRLDPGAKPLGLSSHQGHRWAGSHDPRRPPPIPRPGGPDVGILGGV